MLDGRSQELLTKSKRIQATVGLYLLTTGLLFGSQMQPSNWEDWFLEIEAGSLRAQGPLGDSPRLLRLLFPDDTPITVHYRVNGSEVKSVLEQGGWRSDPVRIERSYGAEVVTEEGLTITLRLVPALPLEEGPLQISDQTGVVSVEQITRFPSSYELLLRNNSGQTIVDLKAYYRRKNGSGGIGVGALRWQPGNTYQISAPPSSHTVDLALVFFEDMAFKGALQAATFQLTNRAVALWGQIALAEALETGRLDLRFTGLQLSHQAAGLAEKLRAAYPEFLEVEELQATIAPQLEGELERLRTSLAKSQEFPEEWKTQQMEKVLADLRKLLSQSVLAQRLGLR